MSELASLFKSVLSLPTEHLALVVVGFALVVVFFALRIVVKVLEPTKPKESKSCLSGQKYRVAGFWM
jgi:hypothetical protein